MLKAAEFFVGGQQLVRLNEKVIGEVSRDHGINATEMSILLFLAGNPDLIFLFFCLKILFFAYGQNKGSVHDRNTDLTCFIAIQ